MPYVTQLSAQYRPNIELKKQEVVYVLIDAKIPFSMLDTIDQSILPEN